MAYMLHGVCSTIVHGEHWLSEPPRKSPSLYSVHKMWSRNLVEHSAHRIISQAFGRWIHVSALMEVVIIIRERLIRRSPWSTLPSSSLSEEKSEFEGVHLHHSWRNFLFKWSISNCMALVFFSWERWLPLWDWLLLVWVVCTSTSWSLLRLRSTKWSWR